MTPKSKLTSQRSKNEGWAYLVLASAFLVCFWPWLRHFTTQVFLSLDSTVLYYPVHFWVHSHIPEGKLPLICDLAYHGAPVAAVSMAGVLSPVLWLIHLVPSMTVTANLIFLAPFAIFLPGTYRLGRELGLSSSASLLLAFLWTFNGQRMAQLDHWNVAWACAFFPWAFLALLRYQTTGRFLWLLLGGLALGFNLFSGHPQIVFLEGIFFLFWIFLSAPSPLPLWERAAQKSRVRGGLWTKCLTAGGLLGSAALFASPLILFTLECHTDGFPQWSQVDRFFHSWTPANFLTLIFPWFFGRETYDRLGSDYWWQYQFVEMQVAFSIVGLFFILLYISRKHPLRRFVLATAGFGILMAFGKFFFLYPLVQKLPIFSFFRDPARYWHLAAWALGLGAAFAWDAWFKGDALVPVGRKLSLWIAAGAAGLFLLGVFLLHPGRPLLEGLAAWFTKTFLMGDGVHTQPLEQYLGRIGEKLSAMDAALDIGRPEVFLPFGFLAGLWACVQGRSRWGLNFQKVFLLVLVFADLMAFRMPIGNSFRDPSKLPQPAYPPAQNRSLVLNSGNVSPQPEQYAELSQPNWNLVQGRADLAFDAAPGLMRYDLLLKKLGWFSWVYRNLDPADPLTRIQMLREFGIDQMVMDIPLEHREPFKMKRSNNLYIYDLPEVWPKAFILPPTVSSRKAHRWDPDTSRHHVLAWEETHLAIEASGSSSLPPFIKYESLNFQKTFLPGWKAIRNGKILNLESHGSLMLQVPLLAGPNHIELNFQPNSLRLGFFLAFLLSGLLVGLALGRSRFA